MHVELVIAKVVTMLIGLVIAATAYRGYRRTGSRPMRFLALGFAIISIGAVIEGVLFDVFHFSIFWAGTVQTSVVAIGMLVVLYSLHADGGYTPSELRDPPTRSLEELAEEPPSDEPPSDEPPSDEPPSDEPPSDDGSDDGAGVDDETGIGSTDGEAEGSSANDEPGDGRV